MDDTLFKTPTSALRFLFDRETAHSLSARCVLLYSNAHHMPLYSIMLVDALSRSSLSRATYLSVMLRLLIVYTVIHAHVYVAFDRALLLRQRTQQRAITI